MLRGRPDPARRSVPSLDVPSRDVTDTASTAAARVTPSVDQLTAWRAFLRAHATITRALESELVAEQDLSLAAYDVLVQLAEAPDRRLRMTELADAVLLSRSGVTRLVDRMERVGLVARTRVEGDGRGVAAELTDEGYQRLRVASRTHLAGVLRHFVARLDADDLCALERISRRLSG
ncbi:MarR family transcriptional regulator [Pseudonocardia sp. KRD-169]|uniref:MarR family transcriptional regulator n=1 Tax=Pseudonocardia abyssalis TaxID=2792008 RepID=A0ABS6UXJ5_9PSEU|nr:MarR family transcriptional regulator [Pseudonocardia abyssalis]MBW0136424.1 MarR family transcriptional regulator [Pseudonocardia abyssalis]